MKAGIKRLSVVQNWNGNWFTCCRCVLNVALVFLALSVGLVVGPTYAQTINPNASPALPTIVDQNGINLQSGEFQINGPTVSVGQNGQGGMSYSPFSAKVGNWENDLYASITYDPSVANTLTVTYRNITSVFISYAPQSGDGASLSYNGTNYTFIAHDGTKIIFEDTNSIYVSNDGNVSGWRSTDVHLPDVRKHANEHQLDKQQPRLSIEVQLQLFGVSLHYHCRK